MYQDSAAHRSAIAADCQQFQQFLPIQCTAGHAGTGNDCIAHLPFGLLQCHNIFLNGIACYQFGDKYRIFLSDSMAPVGCLLFCRGIPPRVKMNDLISSGGEAKYFVKENRITVNGENEDRRGRKLYPGDEVTVNGKKYRIN